eukprot:451753_1
MANEELDVDVDVDVDVNVDVNNINNNIMIEQNELKEQEEDYDKVEEILFYKLKKLCDDEIKKTTQQPEILNMNEEKKEDNNDMDDHDDDYYYEFFRQVGDKLQVLKTAAMETQNISAGGLRQDDKNLGGLQSKYSHSDLTTQVHPTVDFSAHLHYDLNEYLSALILAAHTVNHKFQQEIKDKFCINELTSREESLGVKFIQGPVKKLHRCQAKVETKYIGRDYPTSACLLDIVRCSLVFDTIDQLLDGIPKFIQMVQTSQVIKQIVRTKNMFNKFDTKNPKYADIKMNVLINGKPNVIGEVQFLVLKMAQFKHISHRFYDITRQNEWYNNIFNVLSTHKSIKTSLMIATDLGSKSRICNLMITHGITQEKWLQRNEYNQNILYNMCKLNHAKAFKLLLNITTNKKELVENIFINQKKGRQQNAMYWIITRDCIEIWNELWKTKAFRARIMNPKKTAILTINEGHNTNRESDKMSELTKIALQIFLYGDDTWIDLIREKLEKENKWIHFIQRGPGESDKTWLMYAAENGKTNIAKAILKSFDTNTDTNDIKKYLQKKYKEKQAIEMTINAPNGSGATILQLLTETYNDLKIGSIQMGLHLALEFKDKYPSAKISIRN